MVSERDRLAALSTGHAGAPVGLGTYLRDQVDKIRGTDDIHTRRERMRKLDGRIKEVSVFFVVVFPFPAGVTEGMEGDGDGDVCLGLGVNLRLRPLAESARLIRVLRPLLTLRRTPSSL